MKVRHIIGAVVVSSTVFGSVYAAAATMDLDGGTAQQGTDATLECQDGTVRADWGINAADNPETSGQATFVQLSGVEESCNGNRLMGRLENAAGDVVGYLTTIDPASGAASTVPAPGVVFIGAPSVENKGGGSYKFQLIDPAGGFGVDVSGIGALKLWIEGGAQAG